MEVLWLRGRSERTRALVDGSGVVACVMSHKGDVLEGGPVYAIAGEIVYHLIERFWTNVHTPGSVSNHAEHEKLAGAGRGLTPYVQNMSVPALCPFLRILVQNV